MDFTRLSLAGGGGGHCDLPLPNPDTTPSVDLHMKLPLPSDWEQCLDLQTGKMYYVNRKTGRKRWTRPEEQKVDLELKISAGAGAGDKEMMMSECTSSMVARPCSKCHLLVILSTSSPSCPNCKYVHALGLSSSPPSSSVHYASSVGPSSWRL